MLHCQRKLQNMVLLILAGWKYSNAEGTRIKHIIGGLYQYVSGHEYNSKVGIIPEKIPLPLAEESRSDIWCYEVNLGGRQKRVRKEKEREGGEKEASNGDGGKIKNSKSSCHRRKTDWEGKKTQTQMAEEIYCQAAHQASQPDRLSHQTCTVMCEFLPRLSWV